MGKRGRPRKDTTPKQAPAGAGHNSGDLTDEQRSALTYQHLGLYERSLETKKKADADFKNACKKIRADLGPWAIRDITDIISLREPEGEQAFRDELARKARIARWESLDMGETADFFGGQAGDRARGEGKTAARKGEPAKSPYAPGSAEDQQWLDGWHEMTAKLSEDRVRDGIKPLEDDEKSGDAVDQLVH
jgi:hypothetical protein